MPLPPEGANGVWEGEVFTLLLPQDCVNISPPFSCVQVSETGSFIWGYEHVLVFVEGYTMEFGCVGDNMGPSSGVHWT